MKIFVLDISRHQENEYTLRKNVVPIPSIPENNMQHFKMSYVILEGDESEDVILDGYLRRICRKLQFNMLTNDILGIEEICYNNEYVHVLSLSKHYVISVLSMLSCKK